jgi:hypothetical protein
VNVTVEMKIDEDSNKYVIEVNVQSQKKKTLNATTKIDPGKATNEQHLRALVEAAGCACAEYLNERHRENHDPGKCGRAAVGDFARECRMVVELSKGLPEKIATLYRGPLEDIDRERVDRLKHRLDRFGTATREESAWITSLLKMRSRRGTAL